MFCLKIQSLFLWTCTLCDPSWLICVSHCLRFPSNWRWQILQIPGLRCFWSSLQRSSRPNIYLHGKITKASLAPYSSRCPCCFWKSSYLGCSVKFKRSLVGWLEVCACECACPCTRMALYCDCLNSVELKSFLCVQVKIFWKNCSYVLTIATQFFLHALVVNGWWKNST